MARLNSDNYYKNLAPCEKPRKYSDGDGLYLLVKPSGVKLWRMKYYFNKKEKLLSFGEYPHPVSLKDARAKRDEAKALIAKGIDPSENKKALKKEAERKAKEPELTFEKVAREWLERKKGFISDTSFNDYSSLMERLLFPILGKIALASVEPIDILKALRVVENEGHVYTAHRLRSLVGGICDYAMACGYCKFNAAAGLSKALKPIPPVKHRQTITEESQVGNLLRAIDANETNGASIYYAMKIKAYLPVRSTELCQAKWEEIDFEKAIWTVPGERMKMRRPHIVPLPRQVIDLLRELQPFSGNSPYLFPSHRKIGVPISRSSLLRALESLGYKGIMTAHGFRGMFSTMCNRMRLPSDIIERNLAHAGRDQVALAYDHYDYLKEKREVLQTWADYLDKLRDGQLPSTMDTPKIPAGQTESMDQGEA